ncbi:MAG: PAS domain S-box protein [Bacteroidetes bacterium]|nr:PAS domain S-box protein [Bacteroidota bacterium]
MKKDTLAEAAALLRHKAEELLKRKLENVDVELSESQMIRLIHELEVHHIELEMQYEELILAKEEAAAAVAKYAALYDFAPTGYYTLSIEGNILELNLCGSKMLGKDRSHLINSTFGFFVSPATHPGYNNFLDRVFKSQVKTTCEVVLLGVGDVPMYVHLTGIMAEDGEQCLLTAVDFTEHRRVEEKLVESEEKYRTIFENVQDVFYRTDLSGNVLEISPSIKHFSDFDKDEILGMNVSSLYENPDDRLIFLDTIAQRGFLNDYELKLKTRTGKTRYASINARLIFDAGGQPNHIDGAIRDITERKLAEIALKKKSDDLEYFNHLMVDRELKMIELKKEINELLKKAGKEEKYIIHT